MKAVSPLSAPKATLREPFGRVDLSAISKPSKKLLKQPQTTGLLRHGKRVCRDLCGARHGETIRKRLCSTRRGGVAWSAWSNGTRSKVVGGYGVCATGIVRNERWRRASSFGSDSSFGGRKPRTGRIAVARVVQCLTWAV